MKTKPRTIELRLKQDEFDGDAAYTLSEVRTRVAALIKKYGTRARLRFDAGYNNVSAVIQPARMK